MRRQVSISPRPVCQLCELLSRNTKPNSGPRSGSVSGSVLSSAGPGSFSRRKPWQHTPGSRQFSTTISKKTLRLGLPRLSSQPTPSQSRWFVSTPQRLSNTDGPLDLSSTSNSQPDIERLVASVVTMRKRVADLPEDSVPSKQAILEFLSSLHKIARAVLDTATVPSGTTASTLLNLQGSSSPEDNVDDSRPESTGSPGSIAGSLRDTINLISDTAYELIAHPSVFICPEVLDKYVILQSHLGQPETLGHVFQLYANKLVPRLSGRTLKHVAQNPSKVSNAIPKELAHKALDAAIAARNLDAAVAVIESSVCAPAYRRMKLVRRGILPASATVLVPLAIYDISSSLADIQNTMDRGTATFVAFSGILAYVGFTASLGVISVFTSNDHMKRVTWVMGTPLRHRWLREDERAAYDKLACAWGFAERSRYGEETGQEWVLLREFLGRRGLILDAIELMDGMH